MTVQFDKASTQLPFGMSNLSNSKAHFSTTSIKWLNFSRHFNCVSSIKSSSFSPVSDVCNQHFTSTWLCLKLYPTDQLQWRYWPWTSAGRAEQHFPPDLKETILEKDRRIRSKVGLKSFLLFFCIPQSADWIAQHKVKHTWISSDIFYLLSKHA